MGNPVCFEKGRVLLKPLRVIKIINRTAQAGGGFTPPCPNLNKILIGRVQLGHSKKNFRDSGDHPLSQPGSPKRRGGKPWSIGKFENNPKINVVDIREYQQIWKIFKK